MSNIDVVCPFEDGEIYVYGAIDKVGCTAVTEALKEQGFNAHDMGANHYGFDDEDKQVILVYDDYRHISKHWLNIGGVVLMDFKRCFYKGKYWELLNNNTALLNELMHLLPPDNPIRLEREQLLN